MPTAESGPAVALITGANGGIGSALCAAFQEGGYQVVATDLHDRGSAPTYLPFDLRLLSDPTHGRQFRDRVAKAVGGAPVHVLVNNAATQLLARTEDVSPVDWRDTLAVNFSAPFWLTQLFLGDLVATAGSVVNISSVHAQATKPQFVAYASSKAALIGLTRALAVDLGGRVRVNAILPAATATPMLKAGFASNASAMTALAEVHPIGRIASPEEIGTVATFLASDRAAFITGACWTVDGGVLSRLHDPV
jgi:NAD(P)-dependent dehydrogenase (short-subunit alcohol dehydrogenase family)